MTSTPAIVPPEEVGSIAVLAGELLSADEVLPGTADLTDFGDWLLMALQARQDLIGAVRTALASTTGLGAREALSSLVVSHPAEFAALTTVIAGAYLMHPDVRAALGYPGQVPRGGRSDVDEYASMLESVFDRGDRYRHAPD